MAISAGSPASTIVSRDADGTSRADPDQMRAVTIFLDGDPQEPPVVGALTEEPESVGLAGLPGPDP
jgi:hypothetical protein